MRLGQIFASSPYPMIGPISEWSRNKQTTAIKHTNNSQETSMELSESIQKNPCSSSLFELSLDKTHHEHYLLPSLKLK